MTNHDPVITLLADANPAAPMDEPPIQVMSQESLLELIHRRVGVVPDAEDLVLLRRGVPWRGVAIGLAAACIALLFALPLMWFFRDSASSPPAGPGDSTVPTVDESAPPGSPAWDPVLTEVTARPVEALRECPSGTNPDARGPDTTDRPGNFLGNPSNQAAVFDALRGLIVVIDGSGETWTFDVCRNSWTAMAANTDAWLLPFERRFDDDGSRLAVYTGDLAYDVDSDRTIAFGNLGAYDYDTNAWVGLSSEGKVKDRDMVRGTVYDPVSGLVIVAHTIEVPDVQEFERDPVLALSSFDVDTDTWNLIGELDVMPWGFLIGYSASADRLIFIEPGPGADNQTPDNIPRTFLVDPRTGRTTDVIRPSPDIFAPWGAWYPYAVGVDGAAVVDIYEPFFGQGDVCLFRGDTLGWDSCAIDSIDGPKRSLENAPSVYDPVNERLVFILNTGDVWAVDLETGVWIELR